MATLRNLQIIENLFLILLLSPLSHTYSHREGEGVGGQGEEVEGRDVSGGEAEVTVAQGAQWQHFWPEPQCWLHWQRHPAAVNRAAPL